MHIGIITRGETTYALNIANQMINAGNKVSLYLCHSEVEEEMGISDRPAERLYDAGIIPRECKVRLISYPRMRDIRSISFFRKLSRTVFDDHVDVVHLLTCSGEPWLGLLACLLRRMVPVTSTMIQPTRHIGEGIPYPLFWASYKLLTVGSDMIIVNGVDLPEKVHKLYGFPFDRASFVPLSARTTSIKWTTKTELEEPETILFFGRAVPFKGLEYLVKAQPFITSQIPQARILISAYGDDLARCRLMIQDESCFEIHDGVVPNDEMALLFQRSSVVALPYISSTSSGVLMTAYTFGKPVVASNISGLSEYVEEGVTGLLVPPKDEKQLADAIIRLLKDNELRRQMGKNAKQWMEDQQENVTKKTIEAYEKAINMHQLRNNERERNQ